MERSTKKTNIFATIVVLALALIIALLMQVPKEVVSVDKVYPTDDARVHQEWPNETYSEDIIVKTWGPGWSGGNYFPDGRNARSFIKFDVSSILPSSTVVAKLKAYMTVAQSFLGGVTDIQACRVDNDNWSETDLTWNNQPTFDSVVYTLPSYEGGTDVWVEWNLTSWVQNELAGDKIVSVCLKFAQESYDDTSRLTRIRSKESNGQEYWASLRPHLHIDGGFTEVRRIPYDWLLLLALLTSVAIALIWYKRPVPKSIYFWISIPAVIAFLLPLFSMISAPLASASPEEATFYSTTSDGYIQTANNVENYHDARDATVGTVNDNTPEIEIGQSAWVGDSYGIYRGFVFFDTSIIPNDATITSATLSLYGYWAYLNDNFDVVVQTGGANYPHDPLVAGDYNRAHYSGDGGSFNTSTFDNEGYNDIVLNATGRSWINKQGYTTFCLRSSKDISGTPPSLNTSEQIQIWSGENSVAAPKLAVTYEVPEQPPWTPPEEPPEEPPDTPPPPPPTPENVIENTPLLPPPTPSGTRTPDWLWLLLLVALCFLEYEIMKKDDWNRTPMNTDRGSDPGSWTFIWSSRGAITMLVLGTLGLLAIYDSFGISTALWIYAAFIGIAGLALLIEHINPRLFPAYIDLGNYEELGRLVVGGAIMGAIWLLLTGLLTEWLGVTYVVKPIVEIPWLHWLHPMSMAVSIAFIGFLAPVIEEKCFRQTLAPTIAEKLGIMPGIAISGLLFGVAHYAFGGSIALAVSASGFGIMLAYFVLRHQGAAFAYSAHMTYNMLVIVINYLLWAV